MRRLITARRCKRRGVRLPVIPFTDFFRVVPVEGRYNSEEYSQQRRWLYSQSDYLRN